MLLLVGLGNPGKEYESNRHNVGFMVIDSLIKEFPFKTLNGKFDGELHKSSCGEVGFFALKPNTFMNRSGKSVAKVMQFYKLKPEDIIVFHDELDLEPGKVKIKTGGSNGGHNGIKSIDEHIGKNYKRVRIGIGRPEYKSQVNSYVLGNFSEEEEKIKERTIKSIIDNIMTLLAGDDSKMMNDIALKVR